MALQCTRILEPYAIEETVSAQSNFERRFSQSFLSESKVPAMLAMLALFGHVPHLGAEYFVVSNPRTSWVEELAKPCPKTIISWKNWCVVGIHSA